MTGSNLSTTKKRPRIGPLLPVLLVLALSPVLGPAQDPTLPADPPPRDSLAVPEDSLPEAPPDSLALASDSLGIEPDSLALAVDSLEVPPDSLALASDSLGTEPDSPALAVDSLEVPPDSLALASDSLGTEPLAVDSLEVPPDSLALASDSLGIEPDSLALAPDSLHIAPASPPSALDSIGLGELSEPSPRIRRSRTVGRLDMRPGAALRKSHVQRREPGEETWIRPLWNFAPTWHPLEDQLLTRVYFAQRAVSYVEDTLGIFVGKAGVPRSEFPSYLSPEHLELQVRSQLTLQHAPDLESRTIERYYVFRDVVLGPRVREPYDAYLSRLTKRQVRSLWKQEISRSFGKTQVGSPTSGLVKISLPVEIPSALSPIFGKGEPNLSVRGSERITIGGTSRWNPDQRETEFQRKQSKFPQLDMKQELSLRLSGNIGDKVTVDVDQSSQAATPLENRIRIHYTGYEDEIIQRVDLGNTSLNLPGTRYVSFGGRHQGLFGIKAEAKLGAVDVDMILSKQEGETSEKSVTRSSETFQVKINDLDYVANQYFFLSDPELAPARINPNTINVYVDDRIGTNNDETGTIHGFATLDGVYSPDLPDSVVYEGSFDRLRLEEGDYYIQTDLYFGHTVLILDTPLNDENWALVVTYVDSLSGPVGGVDNTDPANPTLVAKMIRPSSNDIQDSADLTKGQWAPTRKLEMKNIYYLRARGILEESLEIKIRRRGTFGGAVDPWREGDFSFLQMTGLDLLEQKSESDWVSSLEGDGVVDPQWVDPEGGFLIFPTLRPFDRSQVDSLRLRGQGGIMQSQGISNPDLIPEIPEEYRNSDVYDRKSFSGERITYSNFYLDVTYRSPLTTLRVDAFNIIEGSEVITAGGRRLSRDRDYRMDYVTGDIELLPEANITEQDEIRVTYSTIPFAGGADKSLFGIAAQYQPVESPLRFSTSWLFDSQGTQDRRPRLGQEPRRTAIGEFAVNYKSEPWFLTSLVDKLPGVDARQRSTFAVDAGLGMSIPNPNTKNRLYIDDFDGAQDILDISVNRLAWKPSGIPRAVPGSTPTEQAGRKGELWYFSPRGVVKEGDLQPTLDETERDDNRTILEMKMFPFGLTGEERSNSWVGVVQSLSRRDLDLSQSQFLDVWINDSRQYRPGVDPSTYRRGVLHIDFGIFSEDAIWQKRDPRAPEWLIASDSLRSPEPNRRLDQEDREPFDGELDQTEGLGEDTGLDGVETGSPGDDLNDDWAFDDDDELTDPNKFARINGMEGNGRLDTEDLNGNGVLDQREAYFSFTIPLDDTSLVETDVFRDFGGRYDVGALNAWRRVRIPLSGAFLDTVSSAAWNKIQHVRLWMEGFADSSALVQIGGIRLSGNRWLDVPIRDEAGKVIPDEELVDRGEEFFPGVLNNKENTDVYSPPFKPRQQGGVEEREQSITLEMRNMPPGHNSWAYRTFASGQDFVTYYETLEFYLNRRIDPPDAEVEFFLRLAKDVTSDTTNYYEYRQPVAPGSGWELVHVDLADLSGLKLGERDSTGYAERDLGGGRTVSMLGQPTLTSVGRIAMGLRVVGGTEVTNGSIWVDELRLTGVRRDVGVAGRLSVDTQLSDFARLSFNLERTDADFLRVGSTRGSGVTQTTMNFNSKVELDRFATWTRFRLPMQFSFQNDRRVPKYRVNSDIELRGLESDRDVSENTRRTFSLGISRQRSGNPLLRFTLDALSANYTHTFSARAEPLTRDTTKTDKGSVSFTPPIGEFRGFRIYKNMKFNPLPNSVSVSSSFSETETSRFQRRDNDLNQPYEKRELAQAVQRSASLSNGLTWRPLGPLSYNYRSSRDLMRRESSSLLGGLNVGTEISRNEQLSASSSVRIFSFLLGPRITPQVTWNGSSTLDLNRPGNAGDSIGVRINNVRNSQTGTISMRVPVEQLLSHLARGSGSKPRDREKEKGDDDEEKGASQRERSTSQRPGAAPSPFGDFLKFGNVNTSYSRGLTSSFNRAQGLPDLAYRLGLTQDPGGGLNQLSGATKVKGKNNTFTATADFSLFRFKGQQPVHLETSYQRTTSETDQVGGSSKTLQTTWPDVDVQWGGLYRRLGLGKILGGSARATTRYERQVRESSRGGAGKERRETTISWSPLLDLTTTLPNGVSLRFNSSVRRTDSEDYVPVVNVTKRRNRQLSLDLSKRLRITRTISLPLTGQTQRIQSELRLSLGLEYRDDRTETSQNVLRDRASLTVSTQGSYQFTSNITGSGSISVGQDTDKKNRNNTVRHVRVDFSASFTF